MIRIFCILASWSLVGTACAEASAAQRADGQVELVVVDSQTGEPLAARMTLRNARGRAVRIRQSDVVSLGDHFYFAGNVLLKLSRGQYTFDLDAGPEYRTQRGHFEIQRHADDSKRIEMQRFANLPDENWYAADLMAGEVAQPNVVMRAAGIHILPAVAWEPSRKTSGVAMLADGPRYFGTDGFAIHAGVLAYQARLAEGWKFRGAGALPAAVEERVAAAGGRLVLASLADQWLPVHLANSRMDAVAVIAPPGLPFEPPVQERKLDDSRYRGPQGAGRFAEEVYFNLLDAGFRLPPVAGSGAPWVDDQFLGAARVYVHVDEPLTYQAWWDGLVAGKVFVTNGPLLRPLVRGQPPGHVFFLDEHEQIELEIGLNLATRDPVDYLEIVKDGQVEHSVRLDEWADRKGRLPPLQFDESGWFLVRAVTTRQDTHQLAATGPYYVEKAGHPRVSRRAVQFFLDWIDALLATEETAAHRAACQQARDYWQRRLALANAD